MVAALFSKKNKNKNKNMRLKKKYKKCKWSGRGARSDLMKRNLEWVHLKALFNNSSPFVLMLIYHKSVRGILQNEIIILLSELRCTADVSTWCNF